LLLGTSVINKALKSKPKKLTLGKDALALKEGTYSGKDFTYSIILYSLIYCAILIDVVELDDSPVSPITYWVSELKLKDIQKTQLLEGAALTDRHIHGASVLLAEQFPDMPSPQCSLRSARLEMMKKAKERSFFFHNFNHHWSLSQIRDGIVYLYDSLQPKIILPELHKQLHILYGDCTLRIPNVQLQRGDTDCGCFAIAFCVTLMLGDDPAMLYYDQKKLRNHIVDCFENMFFSPFPSNPKKSRIPPPMEVSIAL